MVQAGIQESGGGVFRFARAAQKIKVTFFLEEKSAFRRKSAFLF